MSKENAYPLNGFIYIAGALIVIRHFMQIITNLMLLSLGFDAAVLYNIVTGIVVALLVILILLQKRYALYAFFAFQFVNGIVISTFDGKWAVNIAVSTILCSVVAAVLFLKKDGTSAWKAISSRKDVPKQPVSNTVQVIEEKPEPAKQTVYIAEKKIDSAPANPSEKPQKQEGSLFSSQDITPRRKNSTIKYVAFIAACSAIIASALYFAKSNSDTKESKVSHTTDTIKAQSLIGKYLYIDKASVLHAKNGCKAVFKDHNMQQVNPVEPECLSFENLSKVCSRCVTEQMIDSLNILFGKYRQSYNNVGNLYEDLITRNYDLPSELQFRKDIRVPQYTRRIYQILLDEKANAGSYEEFTEWLGLTKPAKCKNKTQP